MDQTENQLLEHVESLRDKQLQWTRDLIAIPTVNPYSGDASAGNEAAGQAWMEDQMRRLGAGCDRVAVPADIYVRAGMIGPVNRQWGGRENVVGRWKLGGGGRDRTILINDHMDTVGTAGMEVAPFDPVVKEGKVFGRGATDSKGNLVMGLIAVEALLRCGNELNGEIVFESVVDEECDGGGAGTLACCLAGVRGDVAVTLDGAAGQIINGCNGIATARLLVRGRSGHTALPGTVNAIDKAMIVKQAIDRFGAEHMRQHPSCRTNIGVFRAGTLPAIVPGLAELQVNMSYPPQDAAEAERTTGRWTGEVFRRRFEKAMEALASADPWFVEKPVEVQWIKDPYPYHWDPLDPAIQIAARAAEEVAGKPVPIRPTAAWFDGCHLARQLKIPTFGMGQGTAACAHASVEYAMVEDLYRGAKTVALTIYRLLRRND